VSDQSNKKDIESANKPAAIIPKRFYLNKTKISYHTSILSFSIMSFGNGLLQPTANID